MHADAITASSDGCSAVLAMPPAALAQNAARRKTSTALLQCKESGTHYLLISSATRSVPSPRAPLSRTQIGFKLLTRVTAHPLKTESSTDHCPDRHDTQLVRIAATGGRLEFTDTPGVDVFQSEVLQRRPSQTVSGTRLYTVHILSMPILFKSASARTGRGFRARGEHRGRAAGGEYPQLPTMVTHVRRAYPQACGRALDSNGAASASPMPGCRAGLFTRVPCALLVTSCLDAAAPNFVPTPVRAPV